MILSVRVHLTLPEGRGNGYIYHPSTEVLTGHQHHCNIECI